MDDDADVSVALECAADVIWERTPSMKDVLGFMAFMCNMTEEGVLEYMRGSELWGVATSMGVDVGVRNLGLCMLRCCWRLGDKLKKKDIRVRCEVIRWQRVDIQDPERNRDVFPAVDPCFSFITHTPRNAPDVRVQSEGSGVMNLVSMEMVRLAGHVLEPFMGDDVCDVRFLGIEQQPYPSNRGGSKKQQIKMWTFAHCLGAHILGIAMGRGNRDVLLSSLSAQGRSIESEPPPIFHKDGKKRTQKEYHMKKEWAVDQCVRLVREGREWFTDLRERKQKVDDLADAFLLALRVTEKCVCEEWSTSRKRARAEMSAAPPGVESSDAGEGMSDVIVDLGSDLEDDDL